MVSPLQISSQGQSLGYWRSPAPSTMFSKRTSLDVIHCIINVWNLNSHQTSHLACDEFKALESHMVVDENSTTEPYKALVIGLPMLSALVSIITTRAGLPKLLYPSLHVSCWQSGYMICIRNREELQLFIRYLPQRVLASRSRPRSRFGTQTPNYDTLHQACLLRQASADCLQIDQHVKDKKVFNGRDITINDIVELINLHRIVSVEAFKAKYADMLKDKG